jgi:hypothetical protein
MKRKRICVVPVPIKLACRDEDKDAICATSLIYPSTVFPYPNSMDATQAHESGKCVVIVRAMRTLYI